MEEKNIESNSIISLKGVNKIYPGGTHAVKDLDLEISKGEIFAFLGTNGAGKTTTLRMLSGLCRPSSGQIVIAGKSINEDRKNRMMKIGMVSQHFNIEPDLTGYENLKIHAYLYGITGKKLRESCERMLEFAGLSEKRDVIARRYSGGMKRRLQIVRALLHEPEILLLDEPTTGLDPAGRERIWDLIKGLSREGKTVFFSTHYMEEAEHYARRVGVIDEGRLITLDSPAALIEAKGGWCRESFSEGRTVREYFRSRGEAAALSGEGELVIRATQLKDIFIELTERGNKR